MNDPAVLSLPNTLCSNIVGKDFYKIPLPVFWKHRASFSKKNYGNNSTSFWVFKVLLTKFYDMFLLKKN